MYSNLSGPVVWIKRYLRTYILSLKKCFNYIDVWIFANISYTSVIVIQTSRSTQL